MKVWRAPIGRRACFGAGQARVVTSPEPINPGALAGPPMPGASPRPGGWRNLALGVVFAALGVVGFLEGPSELRWQLGGAGVFLGAFVVVVLGPWSQARPLALGHEEARRTLEGLSRDLELDGPLFVVGPRAQPHLSEARLFLAEGPLDPSGLPDLDAETTLYVGDAPGLALVPPGLGLLEAHERAQGVRLDQLSLGELDTVLGGLVPGSRVVEGLVVRHVGEPGTVRVRYAPLGEDALHPLGRDEVETDGPEAGVDPSEAAARVAASPVATALLVAVSDALQEPIRVETLRSRETGEIEVEVSYER